MNSNISQSIKQKLNQIHHLKHTIKDYNKLIKLTKNTQEIELILKEINTKELKLNIHSKNILMKMFLKFNETVKAIEIFEGMKLKQELNISSFDILLQGMVEKNHLELAFDYLKIMHTGGFQSRISMMLWMDICLKKGDLKEAMNVLDMVLILQTGMKMLELLEKYQVNNPARLDLDIDNVTSVGNVMIQLNEEDKIIIENAKKNEDCEKVDIYLDIQMCTTLLAGLARLESHDYIKKLLKIMKILRVPKNLRFYEVLLNYEANHANLDYAFDIVQDLSTKGIYVTNISHFNLLKGCFKQKQPEKALMYLKKLQKQGTRVTLSMYITCLQGFQEFGMDEEFYFLFDLVQLNPNVPLLVYNMALQQALAKNDYLKFQEIKTMLDKDPNQKPNEKTFEMQLSIYIKIRDVENAIETLLYMQNMGYAVQTEYVLSLIAITKQVKHFKRLSSFLIDAKASPSLKKCIDSVKPHLDIMLKTIMNEADNSHTQNADHLLIQNIFQEFYQNGQASTQMLLTMIKIYKMQGDLINVIKTWDKLIKVKPPTPMELSLLLNAVAELGQSRTNLAILKMIEAKKYQLDADCYLQLFHIIGRYGNFEDLTKYYADYIDINPNINQAYSKIKQGMENRKQDDGFIKKVEDFFQEFFPEAMMEC
jgi:pentatricopeptide repeat protein